jgi:hypothetical protein
MIFRSLLAAAALLFAVPSAHAAFDFGDLICESSTTTGTGTLDLAGALTNYVGFASQITSASVVPYHIIASDGKLEVGYGVYTDAATDTLTRVANWSTDGSGAELTLPAGTHSVCVGPNTQMYNGFKGMQFYNNDAGAVGAILPLWHDSASAADGDIAGEVQIWGGADDEEIGQIRMEVDDGSTTSEDTLWQFVRRVAGSDVTALALGGASLASSGTGTAFHNSGRVENQVTDDSAFGTYFSTYHNSADPAASDEIGGYLSYGKNDAAGDVRYSKIATFITDPASASDDSRMDFIIRSAAANLTALTLGTTVTHPVAGAVLTDSFDLGDNSSAALHITNSSDTQGPIIIFDQASPGPAAADYVGRVFFGGKDGAGNDQFYASLSGMITDTTSTTEDGAIQMFVTVAGTATAVVQVGATVALSQDNTPIFMAANGILGLDNGSGANFYETEANGDNFKGFISAAANTADTTCTFENDANFIPDSCVGDGSDASDGRIKANLKPAGDVGGMIDGIKIYDYEWTVDAPNASEDVRKGKHGFGPLAQELFKINPDWVEVGGDDPIKDPWTWKPEKVVPYLIVEVQNLRKRLANSACYGIKLGNACIGVSM